MSSFDREDAGPAILFGMVVGVIICFYILSPMAQAAWMQYEKLELTNQSDRSIVLTVSDQAAMDRIKQYHKWLSDSREIIVIGARYKDEEPKKMWR